MTKVKIPSAKSLGEETFYLHILLDKVPLPKRQFKFHDVRQWQADFCWPELKLIVEIDGITGGAGGRHQRAEGFSEDCIKLNVATLLGYAVLRFTPKHVKSGYAIQTVKDFIALKHSRSATV